MLKLSAVAFSFFSCIVSVQAEEFMFMRCSEIVDHPERSSVIVGWANLQNRDGTTQTFDFNLYAQQADALLESCRLTPDLPLRTALGETFSVVGDDMTWSQTAKHASR